MALFAAERFETCTGENGPAVLCLQDAGALAVAVVYEEDGLVVAVPGNLTTMFEGVLGPTDISVA
eukprot:3126784-Amphidinium_carterae.1